MTARMKNPATLLPQATELLMGLGKIGTQYGIDEATLELTHLRVSQINGCAWCLELGRQNAGRSGLTDSQVIQVAGWSDAAIFSDAQRAALALAEHMTRMADRSDAVPDAIWDEAARHYGEKELAGLVVWIATTNLYNRINVTTKQVPGTW